MYTVMVSLLVPEQAVKLSPSVPAITAESATSPIFFPLPFIKTSSCYFPQVPEKLPCSPQQIHSLSRTGRSSLLLRPGIYEHSANIRIAYGTPHFHIPRTIFTFDKKIARTFYSVNSIFVKIQQNYFCSTNLTHFGNIVQKVNQFLLQRVSIKNYIFL